MKRKRRILRAKVLIPAITVLLALAVSYLYFCYHFPEGSGPAGPAVPRELFTKPWTDRSVLLLGIGDSVTQGFGVPKTHSYFGRLAKNPDDEFDDMRGLCLSAVIPKLSVRNIAVSGSNSFDHVQKQIAALQTQAPDVLGVVVMTSGGNDIIHDYGRSGPREGAMYGAGLEQAQPWIANYESRLEYMIAQLNGKFPGGCEIFLADIYDPTDGQGVPWIAPYPKWEDQVPILDRYNEIIRRTCSKYSNVHLVPMHEAFRGHGLCCSRFWKSCYRKDDPTVWYALNIEDPNIRGYDAIRRLFLLEMAKVLPRTR